MQKQKGAAILIIAVILLIAALLSMIYATNHGMFQQKTATNQYADIQSHEAAQAGLEFGLAYLGANSATILANPSGGYINYGASDTNLTNVLLANNSKYSVVFTNPTQSSYTTLRMTSTGISADGTSTAVITEDVAQAASSMSTATIVGSISSSGKGGNITGANAVTAGGSVDPNAVAGGTISANNNSITDLTGLELFTSIFGISEAAQQSQSSVYLSSALVPWNTVTGAVWVTGSVSLSGNTTVGTVANPVVLIVTGSLSLSGNSTINGIVYTMGSAAFSGTSAINGFLVSQGSIAFSGNTSLNYNSSIANKLAVTGSVAGGYAIIPGSWHDF